jgi:3-dehydroquinate synthase
MKIKSNVREYEVSYHSSFSDCLKVGTLTGSYCIIVDANVYKIYRNEIDLHLSNFPILVIDALESNKSFEKVGEYIIKLLDMKCKKDTHLFVIGGGILQDIGGFIASILYRGVNWTLVPTTVLAQCDSCIGSKTSMNIASFKNQLGTFYPPSCVLITTQVLSSLTQQDQISGVCEAVKLAMIESLEASDLMRSSLKQGLTQKTFLEICDQSLQIKKKFIEEDEFDKGRRNLLNYGHTFAHAFESASKYEIPHGIAVGLGIWAASYFSLKLGMIENNQYENAVKDISPWCQDFVPALKRLSLDEIMKSIKTDKKNTVDRIGFILTSGYGKMQRSYMPVDEAKVFMTDFLQELGRL